MTSYPYHFTGQRVEVEGQNVYAEFIGSKQQQQQRQQQQYGGGRDKPRMSIAHYTVPVTCLALLQQRGENRQGCRVVKAKQNPFLHFGEF